MILKFLKNELGGNFDSIYEEEMNKIESSNYADDGEFSVMPNKLSRSLNKIFKKAEVTPDNVAAVDAVALYFKQLINKAKTPETLNKVRDGIICS